MKTLLRLLLFWIKLLAAVMVIAAIAGSAFFIAMDMTNLWILSTDGMQARAEAILYKDEYDTTELQKYFTSDYLDRDAMLLNNPYSDYAISKWDLKVDQQWLWCWPWQNEVNVTIKQRMTTLEGELREEFLTDDQKQSEEEFPPPAWQSARYKLVCKRIDGRWKISDIIFLEAIADPQPSVSPTPSASPSQSPQDTAAQSPAAS
nr:hypothetical protein [Maliibacterium massiliense]